ncbi:hypothetical protein I307_05073 [Cryptococcus deuterogattii 99/473]|uniref:Unplaced genomic scaffold supercont1.2, whole genome shotgun sequence n=1 Tax=Cryptococcus deuterogattii Ram5 TaxID=1296110 RepID=A0A0D0U409_9TREE|nr:hypothetical protein I309_06190 [Cryptococcus deuterogattii LA55]KIR42908.1 hypothetical protein I313_01113 [Cryptococcus deuterogattii Ram5]KIR75567.1 hypothetical protein I310_00262 [Cryptococcus deuterogattii CA1014]KIR95507.1 hypothetical protein I304_00260 [Cryptococcus deuterogattii CBS 10090]KIY55484.1 hypothetical protein I307_05073 [Cryptococcus deuterogattii 99/473]
MPVLSPAVDRIRHVADPILKWGFFIIISALLVQMLGLLPGVPYIHITYVHMVTAFLLFAILWNTFVPVPNAQMEENKALPPKEDKLTAGKKRESSKEETKKEEEASPWEDLRAHPSAFLTTRLNKMMPWPFPMGKAVKGGKELWWEKGTHLQLGHFNKARPGKVKEEEESEKNIKPKPGTEKKLKEKTEESGREEERRKGSMITGSEKISSRKKMAPGEAATATSTPRREEDKRNQEIEKTKESNMSNQVMDARQRQKLCRTKNLVMIIGISSINMALGFLLLIFYSFQIISQELSHPMTPSEKLATPHSNSNSSSSSSGFLETASRSVSANEKEPTKLKVVKENAVSNEKVSSSKPSSVRPDEMPASRKSIQKPTGSNKVTKVDADDDGTSTGTPNQQVEIGMHYIFNPEGKGGENVRNSSMQIPSLGMPHPLMTTTYKQYAN